MKRKDVKLEEVFRLPPGSREEMDRALERIKGRLQSNTAANPDPSVEKRVLRADRSGPARSRAICRGEQGYPSLGSGARGGTDFTTERARRRDLAPNGVQAREPGPDRVRPLLQLRNLAGTHDGRLGDSNATAPNRSWPRRLRRRHFGLRRRLPIR